MTTNSRTFFEGTYEGRRFAAILSVDGPYILDIDRSEGVAIGPSEITCCARGVGFRHMQEGWCVAKYGTEPRINLVGMSQIAREELARDFGLPICDMENINNGFGELFNGSAAFEGLCRWVMAHPRLYKKMQRYGRSYMSWPEMVEAWKSKATVMVQ
jgi:hypothetical protein